MTRRSRWHGRPAVLAWTAVLILAVAGDAVANPNVWRSEWPRTDFSRHSVPFDEIMSGGPSKDGIPAIDSPSFAPASAPGGLAPNEPVISLTIAGDARAYPLRIMIWHEIVNDTIGGVPVAVTWCPLCNSSVVFDRRLDGRTLSFGTTGKLRHSDLVMYDRETETWWQQFSGVAIVGALVDRELKPLPSRVESVARFRARHPDGNILVPPGGAARPYGRNPYVGYDKSNWPFLFQGEYKDRVPPLSRVVVVGGEAWSLQLLMRKRRIEAGDLLITWEPGQASALDAADIVSGDDIGNVVVQRRGAQGWQDEVHDVSFAFAFRAFHPHGRLHHE
ncbi:MAG: DUF3179 domain-containing protein [Alphaproteobacteria bacterium]